MEDFRHVVGDVAGDEDLCHKSLIASFPIWAPTRCMTNVVPRVLRVIGVSRSVMAEQKRGFKERMTEISTIFWKSWLSALHVLAASLPAGRERRDKQAQLLARMQIK